MLATPILTVTSPWPTDQCATLLRMVSATPCAAVALPPRQQHGELLAAESRGAVAGALHRVADAQRDADQHLIAGLVTVAVVECLEVIGVDDQQRDRRVHTQRAAPFALDQGIELAAVDQPGQRIGSGEFFQPALGLGAAVDLADKEDGEAGDDDREPEQNKADSDRLMAPHPEDIAP